MMNILAFTLRRLNVAFCVLCFVPTFFRAEIIKSKIDQNILDDAERLKNATALLNTAAESIRGSNFSHGFTDTRLLSQSTPTRLCEVPDDKVLAQRRGVEPRLTKGEIENWIVHNCYNRSFPLQLPSRSTRSHCPDISKQLRQSYRKQCNSELTVPRGCELKWYTGSEACDLLGDTEVGFFGDSLTRHLVQTLFSILTSEYTRGTMQWGRMADEEFFQRYCVCNNDYNDNPKYYNGKTCRPHTVVRYTGKQSHHCPKWSVNHIFPFELYKLPEINIKETIEEFKILASSKQSIKRKIIYVMLGHHFKLSPTDVKLFLDPLADISRSHDVTVIIGTLPEVDETLIDPRYVFLTNRKDTYVFNDFLRSYVESLNNPRWVLFENAYITKDAVSVDGLHYPQAINVLLAQIFLNHVDHVKQGLIGVAPRSASSAPPPVPTPPRPPSPSAASKPAQTSGSNLRASSQTHSHRQQRQDTAL